MRLKKSPLVSSTMNSRNLRWDFMKFEQWFRAMPSSGQLNFKTKILVVEVDGLVGSHYQLNHEGMGRRERRHTSIFARGVDGCPD